MNETRQSVTTSDGVVLTVETTDLTIGLLRAEVAALRLEIARLRRLLDTRTEDPS